MLDSIVLTRRRSILLSGESSFGKEMCNNFNQIDLKLINDKLAACAKLVGQTIVAMLNHPNLVVSGIAHAHCNLYITRFKHPQPQNPTAWLRLCNGILPLNTDLLLS